MSQESKVKVGMVYSAKIGGAYVAVKAIQSLGHGRWKGTSMPGGAPVKFSTDAIRGDGMTPEDWTAKHAPKEHDLPTPAPAAKDEKPKTAGKAKDKKEHKPSGLDAAVTVLSEAGKPMNCGDLVKRMLETGLWQTNGKTPASTIYAAIITEIAKKGDASRFRKVDRGQFELTAAGKEA